MTATALKLEAPAVPATPALGASGEFRRGVIIGVVGLTVAWPLGLVYFGWPLLGIVAILACAVRRYRLVPRVLVPWVALVLLNMFSFAQVETTTSRFVAYGYRLALLLSATACAVYVYNAGLRLMAERFFGILSGFLVVTTATGLLGMVLENFTQPGFLLRVVPGLPAEAKYIVDVTTMQLATVQNILGEADARPKGIFAYTNDWAANFALLAVMVLAYQLHRRRPSLGWLAVVAVGVLPLVYSLSRGAWISLLAGFGVVAVRRLKGGGFGAAAFVAVALLLGYGLVSTGPLKTTIESRLEHPHSDEGRSGRISEAWERVQDRPLTGYGTPLPSYERLGPGVGTHGHFWLVLFSQGFPGAIAFALVFAALARLGIRDGAPNQVLLAALVALLVQAFVYEYGPLQLHVLLIAAALAARTSAASSLDLAMLPRIVRRQWRTIVVGVGVGVLGSVAVTARTTPRYEAKARLIITMPTPQNALEALRGARIATDLLNTFSALATSDQVIAGLPGESAGQPADAEQVRANVVVRPDPQTFVLVVTAADSSARRSAEIANGTAEGVVRAVDDLARRGVVPTRARMLDTALVPTSPASPRRRTNLALGLMLGSCGGFVLAGVRERQRRRVHDADEVADTTGLPVLQEVPAHRQARDEPLDSSTRAQEAYRGLRTALTYLRPDESVRSLAVCGAGSSSGATAVAANLAVAIAQTGLSVVVVDADLRSAGLTERLGMAGRDGLLHGVSDGRAVDELAVTWQDGVAVVTTGGRVADPPALLGSDAMRQLLRELEDAYDVVLVDAPGGRQADVAELSHMVDAVVLVARTGHTRADDLTAAMQAFHRAGGGVSGVVVISTRAAESSVR